MIRVGDAVTLVDGRTGHVSKLRDTDGKPTRTRPVVAVDVTITVENWGEEMFITVPVTTVTKGA